MNKRSLGALLVINAALIVGLVVVPGAPQAAEGQAIGTPKNYKMIAGSIPQINDRYDAIYIIEQDTGRAAGLFYDSAGNDWQVIQGSVIGEDISRFGGRAP